MGLLHVWRYKDQDAGTKSASAGNRIRVTSMATMYSTTRPLMPYSTASVV